MYRGSRKHVLDWTSQPLFIPELLELLRPVECSVTAHSVCRPLGFGAPAEARLDQFGPETMPGHVAWPVLTSWWLKHARGANTPNWDIAVACEVEGRPGLVLVEAKANVPELSPAGKRLVNNASARSKENHDHIASAIAEARGALTPLLGAVAIERDRHYQLSNRLAFGWRLASLGVPTVLLYLGFTGDDGIRDVGEPFSGEDHWQRVFLAHLRGVCPPTVLDTPVDLGEAKLWVLSRSRPVIERSPGPSNESLQLTKRRYTPSAGEAPTPPLRS
jgi:hypothetical protein